ncbi:leptin receptor gene-related protein [Megalopta genalis]|uniref:leptin receptor gene-related protein n=1 Tax=Megalopta genalis TaxID=115081 RepID=UPI003FD10256
MTLVILGCALPTYKVWWPFFVVLFYVLALVPTTIARRCTYYAGNSNNPCLELAVFITMGFLVSSFALPIVLSRSPADSPTIQPGACYLILVGNIVVYLTLVGFFVTFEPEDNAYSTW